MSRGAAPAGQHSATAEAVPDRLRTALNDLRIVLQMATPSIDQIHEFGPDNELEKAWQIFYDDVMPALAAAPVTAIEQPRPAVPSNRQLSEVINYAIAACKKSLDVRQIFTVSPTDANGWLARYIMDAIEHYRPDISDVAPVDTQQTSTPADARALCMLVAEAAHRNATGGKAMSSDQVRAIVDEVLAAPSSTEASAPAAPDASLDDWSRISAAANQANQKFGQWMPERWVQLFADAYNAHLRTQPPADSQHGGAA